MLNCPDSGPFLEKSLQARGGWDTPGVPGDCSKDYLSHRKEHYFSGLSLKRSLLKNIGYPSMVLLGELPKPFQRYLKYARICALEALGGTIYTE